MNAQVKTQVAAVEAIEEALWKPPLWMIYKISAVELSKGKGRELGVVIRDDMGDVIVAMVAKIGGATKTAHVEMLAICKAMELAKDFLLNQYILESDCAPIVAQISIQGKKICQAWVTLWKGCSILLTLHPD